jgi:hypothetical protein
VPLGSLGTMVANAGTVEMKGKANVITTNKASFNFNLSNFCFMNDIL